MTDTKLEPGNCKTCKFYFSAARLSCGISLHLGHCRNPAIHAGLVTPDYGCGSWEKRPNVKLEAGQ